MIKKVAKMADKIVKEEMIKELPKLHGEGCGSGSVGKTIVREEAIKEVPVEKIVEKDVIKQAPVQ